MFEKEAEEYLYDRLDPKAIDSVSEFLNKHIEEAIVTSFKDGAEFGYNNANEWHYIKDGDLPKENKLYFVAIKENGLAIAYFNGLHWETRYNLGDFGHCVETVIAWKEIVLPKENE